MKRQSLLKTLLISAVVVIPFRTSMQFIKAMGGTDLVVAEIGGSSHPLPIALFANRRVFDDIHWKLLADRLNQIGKIAANAGMTLCYHHHMRTGVMTRADVDKLAALTDPDLLHFFSITDTSTLPVMIRCTWRKCMQGVSSTFT